MHTQAVYICCDRSFAELILHESFCSYFEASNTQALQIIYPSFRLCFNTFKYQLLKEKLLPSTFCLLLFAMNPRIGWTNTKLWMTPQQLATSISNLRPLLLCPSTINQHLDNRCQGFVGSHSPAEPILGHPFDSSPYHQKH